MVKRSIWIGLGVLGVGIFSVYLAMVHVKYHGLKGGITHAMTEVSEYATGLRGPENRFGDVPLEVNRSHVRDRLKLDRDCATSYSLKGPEYCVLVLKSPSYLQCDWWRLEDCAVLEVNSHLLSRPDMLAFVMMGLDDPCAVLPSRAEVEASRRSTGALSVLGLEPLRRRYGCDADNGPEHSERLILNFVTDDGDVVMTVEKPATD